MVDEHAMTLRLDDDRYERLRNEAFERRITQTDVIREALDEHSAAYFAQPAGERPGFQRSGSWEIYGAHDKGAN